MRFEVHYKCIFNIIKQTYFVKGNERCEIQKQIPSTLPKFCASFLEYMCL